MHGIKVINGQTLEVMGRIDEEHNRANCNRLAESYVKFYGEIVNRDFSSDCIYIYTYANGMVLGFSI